MSAKKQQVLINTRAYREAFKAGKTLYRVVLNSDYKFEVQAHTLRGKPVINVSSRTVGFVEEKSLDQDMNLTPKSRIFFGMSAEQYAQNNFVAHNLNKGAGCKLEGRSYEYEYDEETREVTRKKLPWHPTHAHLEAEMASTRFFGLYCKTKSLSYSGLYGIYLSRYKRTVAKYKNSARLLDAAPPRRVTDPEGVSYVSVVAGILCGVHGEMNYGRDGYVRPAAPGSLHKARGSFLSRRAAEKFAAELNSGVYPETKQIIEQRMEEEEEDRRMFSYMREDYLASEYKYADSEESDSSADQ